VRILVIEDEVKVARFVERGLREENYTVEVARDGDPLSSTPGDIFSGVGTDGVSVNRAGDVLLTSYNGLFLHRASGLSELVRNRTAAPEAGTGAEFTRFPLPCPTMPLRRLTGQFS